MSTQLKAIIPYAAGFSGFVILAFIAFAFLEGTMRWLVLAIGVSDAVITPIVLKKAIETDTS
ncbi:hypothetical protein [Halocatena pleomorpha]|uniref:Uncharacterized protein n=1 Tax=Halocatena pleomorpha TaxID=1785090 RepID=A0A3P3RLT9_9EURY|nr:hypothetical protein [Halocatena pleomorpha]RRJ33810.1 hypothetical protein EIK79_03230 [Halocatena pleomorpha]